MTDIKDIVIYGIVNPETGEVDYIGKAASHRYMERTAEHIRGSIKSSKNMAVVAKALKQKGSSYQRTIIESLYGVTDKEWISIEVQWIDYFKSIGEAKFNQMGGGENPPPATRETALMNLESGRSKGTAFWIGSKHSEESIKQMSESAKNRPANRKGQTNSEEHRQAISDAKKGKPLPHLNNEEAQKKSVDARTGLQRSDDFKKEQSERMLEYYESNPQSDETINKRTESMREAAKRNPDKFDPVKSGAVEASVKNRKKQAENKEGAYSKEANKSRSDKVTDIWAKRNGMTPERKEELVRLYIEEGIGFSKLGRMFGIDRKTASKFCKEDKCLIH